MTAVEVNYDGLPGPTHNYAGLSWGNMASGANAKAVSNPRDAARQGVAKMRTLMDMGFRQGVLPPHERPHVPTLRRLGFTGSDKTVLERAWAADPSLVLSVCSASPMWTANAATVSPAADTADGRVHITPANLAAMAHRAIEHEVTGRILKAAFPDPARFAHHPALPGIAAFGDEGAANHTRLSGAPGGPGVEVFVYGARAFDRTASRPATFPARQTLEASQAVARLHGLEAGRTLFAQQTPALIDAGVFHNDVIAVGHDTVLFHYQDAFVDTPKVLAEIRAALGPAGFTSVEVPAAAVPLGDVVRSYLFNSQLLTRPDTGAMMLLLPVEARETDSVRRYLETLLASDGPIRETRFLDLRQSMRNGGGPACLRLRVTLTDADLAAANPACLMTPALADRLDAWIDRHYRDRLAPDDLRDPALLDECRTALDELTGLLALGPVYDFQRDAA